MMLRRIKICSLQDCPCLKSAWSSLGLASMFYDQKREDTSPMITITQVSFFRIFTIAPHFHSSRTFTVCQTMFTIFVSSSTIASPPHFNSSAEIKSKPAALLFAGAFNPSYISSLEISFIEILVLFILSSKSCTMMGIGSGLH